MNKNPRLQGDMVAFTIKFERTHYIVCNSLIKLLDNVPVWIGLKAASAFVLSRFVPSLFFFF